MDIDVALAMLFEWTGAAAAWTGDLERGARLLGKADEMKERLGGSAPSQMVQTDVHREQAREALGEETYAELQSEGAGLTLAEAIELVERFEPPADAPAMPAAKPWGIAAG